MECKGYHVTLKIITGKLLTTCSEGMKLIYRIGKQQTHCQQSLAHVNVIYLFLTLLLLLLSSED